MKNQFDFIQTSLAGLYKIRRNPIEDKRGGFSRLFCLEEFKKVGLKKNIVQINYSTTNEKGTVRGLHFQKPPFTEAKIVNCTQGEILDVVVDIREGSSTFLHSHQEILSSENHTGLFIPEGFAHGFQALSNNCEILYFHTAIYNAASEGALNLNDPRLKINLPLSIAQISDRDRAHPFVEDDFKGLKV